MSDWTAPKQPRLLLPLVALVLVQTFRDVVAPPVSDWDPKFIAYLKDNKIYVSFHHPFKEARFYSIQVTHEWTVCWDREITNDQIGEPIIFDVNASPCRLPYRVNVYASSENKTALTGLIQTVIYRAHVSTTSPTVTTAIITAPPKKTEFHLLYLVFIAVFLVVIIAAVVIMCRKWSLGRWSTSEQSPGRDCWGRARGDESPLIACQDPERGGPTGNGDDPDPRRVHAIYEHWDPRVSPPVESLMALLRAHGQVDVWPYSQHANAIRSNCHEWVENQMKKTVLVFRREGAAAETEWDSDKDHYNVVRHSLDRLRDHDYDVILVDVTVADDASLNNERQRGEAVVMGKPVAHRAPLARATSDGHVKMADFEELVRKVHGGSYPCCRMRTWQQCDVAQDLLNKVRALREQNAALHPGNEAEVRCGCWDGDDGQEGRALLQGEENTTRMELSALV